MKKVTVYSILFSFLVIIISSCSTSLQINSDYDRKASFSSYKTFSLYNLKAKGNVSQLNQDRIAASIRDEMKKKGFTETAGNPDLLVNAFTVLKNRTGISASTSYYGFGSAYRPYGYWVAPGAAHTSVSTYDYKDGSMLIDVIDAKTNKMIWTGNASAEVYKRPKNAEEVINGVVAKIMVNFPSSSTN